MAADVEVTDGANAMTLSVDHWTYDLKRMPSEFTLKSVPSLGVAKSVTTDFGSFTEMWSIKGNHVTRALAEQMVDYARTEWFVNRPITVTIPALNADDDAVDFTTVSGTEPVITRARVFNDLDVTGAAFPFELVFTVCKRL
jgi:hypothetical protein